MTALTKLALMGLFCATALAQPPDVEWTSIFGTAQDYESAWSMIVSTDQCVVTAGGGGTGDFGWDGYLLKVDTNGEVVWERWLSGFEREILYYDLLECADGGYLVGGYTRPLDNLLACDLLLVRTNSHGDTLWTHQITQPGMEIGGYLAPTADGGYLMTGHSSIEAETVDTVDALLVKADALGNVLWQRTYQGALPISFGNCVGQLPDGGYFIAGGTEPNFVDPARDFQLMRMDADGELLWSQTYGTYDGVLMDGAYTPSDGGFALAGWNNVIGSNYYLLFHLVKTSADGELLWTRSFGHPNCADGARTLLVLPDGGYLLGGWTQPLDSLHDVYVIRLDANGDSLWSLEFEDNGYFAQCEALTQTSEGGFLLACSYGQYMLGGDVELIKLSPELNVDGKILPPVVESVTLMGNYPNPFNAATKISFALPTTQNVTLNVYDVLGRRVRTLLAERMTAGPHQVLFDAGDLPSGSYLYTLEADRVTRSGKMVMVK